MRRDRAPAAATDRASGEGGTGSSDRRILTVEFLLIGVLIFCAVVVVLTALSAGA